jgi:hypothetical protein
MYSLFALAIVAGYLIKLFRKPNPGPDEELASEDTEPILRASGSVPLLQKPDDWSAVLLELRADAVVTYCGTEGRFLRVKTDDNVEGYVVASACVPEEAAKPEMQHA